MRKILIQLYEQAIAGTLTKTNIKQTIKKVRDDNDF